MYCNDNPVMYADPSGCKPKWWQWLISSVSSLANQNSVDAALTSFIFGMIGGFVGAKVSNPIKSTLLRSGSISMGLSITEYLIGFN